MQTTYTASAGDKVSFYWKVSCGSNADLNFYIDGGGRIKGVRYTFCLVLYYLMAERALHFPAIE